MCALLAYLHTYVLSLVCVRDSSTCIMCVCATHLHVSCVRDSSTCHVCVCVHRPTPCHSLPCPTPPLPATLHPNTPPCYAPPCYTPPCPIPPCRTSPPTEGLDLALEGPAVTHPAVTLTHLQSLLLTCSHSYSPAVTLTHPAVTLTHLQSLLLALLSLLLTYSHSYSPAVTFTHPAVTLTRLSLLCVLSAGTHLRRSCWMSFCRHCWLQPCLLPDPDPSPLAPTQLMLPPPGQGHRRPTLHTHQARIQARLKPCSDPGPGPSCAS